MGGHGEGGRARMSIGLGICRGICEMKTLGFALSDICTQMSHSWVSCRRTWVTYHEKHVESWEKMVAKKTELHDIVVAKRKS